MQILQKSDRPTVQLLHKMPDGSSHIDWMIAQGSTDDKRKLITYRLERRLDQLEIGQSIIAKRIADHRWAYLEYEGPISDNRGAVNRVAEGVITSEKHYESNWQIDICWKIDSKSVINQKLQLQEMKASPETSAVKAICKTLEMIEI